MNYEQKLSSKASILIVDDNSRNLQLLGQVLNENHYDIEFAISGKAALDWLTVRNFDLILLDINMPEMSGFELCGKIRSNPVMNNVPVIFLTADSERESILKGFELGAQDYVTKPFDSRELISRVRTHLALKESIEKLDILNRSLEEKVNDRTKQLSEANEKLEAANLKLIDLDKAKAEFLNIISHQIRTPLNGIIGPLELLKDSSYGKEINELAGILDLSVKRLERFALDALLMTRLQSKAIELKSEEIQIVKLINELLTEENNNFLSKNIDVSLKDSTDCLPILGEPELVKICLFNTLNFAVQSSPQNGIIEISIYSQNNHTICEIRDQGNGIPNEDMDSFFEPFKQKKEYNEKTIGLEFPIVKMVMELHGGGIELTNHPEGGTSVKLKFINC